MPDPQPRSYAAFLGPPAEDDAGDAPAAPAAPPSPVRIVEALLFVGGLPLTAARAGEVVRGLGSEQFAETVEALNREYRRQNRPYAVQPQGDGFVLALRPRFQGVRERLFGGPREARLSGPALDVLTLVAYRQPVTRAEIDSQRGSDSGPALRQLVRLGLVAVVPEPAAGSTEAAYGTTARFLELFKLRSLDDLPRTDDLQQL
jgi:segregation and condensation protein B